MTVPDEPFVGRSCLGRERPKTPKTGLPQY